LYYNNRKNKIKKKKSNIEHQSILKNNRKEYMKEYRNHPDYKLQRQAWLDKHSDYYLIWRQKHSDYYLDWRRKNRKKYNEQQKRWRLKNLQKRRSYMRHYMKKYRSARFSKLRMNIK